MTEQEKQILLSDLCARLPYGVKCNVNGDETNTPRKLSRIEVDELDGILLDFWTDREDCLSIQVYLSETKPYLRPMSSMTEEEENEYRAINCYEGLFPRNEDALDYVLSHHLDFRGLIPMSLALEAPNGVYK